MFGIILGIILSIIAYKIKKKTRQEPNESPTYDYVGERPAGGVNLKAFKMDENNAYGLNYQTVNSM